MYISKKMSETLTDTMIETEVIEMESRDIFIYCFEYIFEQIVYITVFLIIGALFHQFKIASIFLLTFYLLRSFGGGIHAPTEQTCTIASFTVYICALLLIPHITYKHTMLWNIILIISIFIIIVLAPVEAPNKPLSQKQKMRMRYQCRWCCAGITLLYFLFYNKGFQLYYGTISICAILVAVGMILGYISNTRHNHFLQEK